MWAACARWSPDSVRRRRSSLPVRPAPAAARSGKGGAEFWSARREGVLHAGPCRGAQLLPGHAPCHPGAPGLLIRAIRFRGSVAGAYLPRPAARQPSPHAHRPASVHGDCAGPRVADDCGKRAPLPTLCPVSESPARIEVRLQTLSQLFNLPDPSPVSRARLGQRRRGVHRFLGARVAAARASSWSCACASAAAGAGGGPGGGGAALLITSTRPQACKGVPRLCAARVQQPPHRRGLPRRALPSARLSGGWARPLGDGLKESLLIGGWVAMWKPPRICPLRLVGRAGRAAPAGPAG